ncbi:hypothetical protein EV198_2829 [Roseivirga ehrenbergii]|uniref:Aromatic ring-opening dioxygenase LigA n=1 Tax=Roseivirga ehrenbergii (strain DSM 102268 / JCM 13514 / KCTC 12282 / NCIMB 14502 / KMM 6017) TaxID=279360 RepID=A0A150XQG7_ROSEK|nr:hypothetical protein [Roseivirga ehrenbergii]KYG80953.1 aromatic ring-opening dioxygenase LigA [Roseivirga ehrenbergii]TCL00813.1 hypothetical protein EV198_2829 [Roseivirga ehrenbergii]
MSTVQLNFVNESNDQNNSEVVIFQKNVAEDFDEIAVAWKVIKNCGRGDYHPFTYSSLYQVAMSDSYGNYTPQLSATQGQAFEMVLASSGDLIKYLGPATAANEIILKNSLQKGAVSGYVYRDGSVAALKSNIAPAQQAIFEFKPTIFIGVASQVTQGQIMNSAIISSINTEISLLGIASADIVMTGGGAGANATPFTFSLENVKMA